MKKFVLLFLPFLLLGAGCAVGTPDQVVDPVSDQAEDTLLMQDGENDDTNTEEEDDLLQVDIDGTASVLTEQSGAVVEADAETSLNLDIPEVVSFDLDGFMFGYSQTELRVKKGQTVTINFTSTGGLHDWVIDAFQASTKQVNTGATTSVTFVADQTGTFEYYCRVGQHRANGMVGTLIVE